MKQETRIGWVRQSMVPPGVWRKLSVLVPEAVVNAMFEFRFHNDDPRLGEVLSLLEASGLQPRRPGVAIPEDRTFRLQVWRQYSKEDLLQYPLFNVFAVHEDMIAYEDAEEGGLFVSKPDLAPYVKENVVESYSAILVSNSMRDAMERCEFGGSRFEKLTLRGELYRNALTGPKLDWSEVPNGPWYHLKSSIIMPPVSERVTLINSAGQRVPPGTQTDCLPSEGFFAIAELRYARSALPEGIMPDVAYTWEYWTKRPVERNRWIIVSNRFMRVAIERKWKVSFAPVHIDEDL